MTLKYRIMSSLYFRPIIDWSAVNAITTLIHNEEKVFNGKYILMALVFDIKEAFDRVTEKQLILYLYKQNILLSLIC